jgi:hypothetical protein
MTSIESLPGSVGTRGAVAWRSASSGWRRRGADSRQIVLTTFTFQAPAFYAKHGFEVVAVVDDHPSGHRNILLRKRLGESS